MAVILIKSLRIYKISKVIMPNDLMNTRLNLKFKISLTCRILFLKFGLLINFSGVRI